MVGEDVEGREAGQEQVAFADCPGDREKLQFYGGVAGFRFRQKSGATLYHSPLFLMPLE